MLSRHPEIVSVPSETYLFSHGIEPLTGLFHHGIPASAATGTIYIERTRLIEITRQFCDEVFGDLAFRLDPRAGRILERTPWHAKHLNLIGEIYPDAKVVHIIRDGRAVVRSLLAQSWGPQGMGEAAAEWVDTVNAARSAHVPQYREVYYEGLKADPAGHLRQLIEWLGLPYDAAIESDVLEEAAIPYNVSFGDGPIELDAWWSARPEQERRAFEVTAGRLLHSLGYGAGPGLTPPPSDSASRSITRILDTVGSRVRAWQSRIKGGSNRAIVPQGNSMGLQMEWVARSVNQVVAAIDARRYDDLSAMLNDDASVTVVRAGSPKTERGSSGRALMVTSLSRSELRRHTKVSAHAQYGPTTCTVVMDYRDVDGQSNALVLVLDFAAVDQRPRIAKVAIYDM